MKCQSAWKKSWRTAPWDIMSVGWCIALEPQHVYMDGNVTETTGWIAMNVVQTFILKLVWSLHFSTSVVRSKMTIPISILCVYCYLANVSILTGKTQCYHCACVHVSELMQLTAQLRLTLTEPASWRLVQTPLISLREVGWQKHYLYWSVILELCRECVSNFIMLFFSTEMFFFYFILSAHCEIWLLWMFLLVSQKHVNTSM